jgi:hypothetical protein
MVYIRSSFAGLVALVSVLFLGIVAFIGWDTGSVTKLPAKAPWESFHTTLVGHGLPQY